MVIILFPLEAMCLSRVTFLCKKCRILLVKNQLEGSMVLTLRMWSPPERGARIALQKED